MNREKRRGGDGEEERASMSDTAIVLHHQLGELKWWGEGAEQRASQEEINDCALIERSKAYSISGQ